MPYAHVFIKLIIRLCIYENDDLVRFVAILLSLTAPLAGAVIRGIVTEAFTGNPLARTLIQIEPIGGTPGAARSVRAGERGSFEFGSLAAGGWILKATRPGFLPLENGQRRWNSAGFPLTVAQDEAPFVSLRMQRFGAISGAVRDENDIGIAGFEVTAWRASQPPSLAARAVSDDRGIYRISGLEPGSYLVRSAAHTEDELQFIPTFASSTIERESAHTVEVFADEEARGRDVRPLQGKLFRLAGVVAGQFPPETTEVTVTLASEMGREVRHGAAFRFEGLAPGEYELYVEARELPPGARIYGAYTKMTISRDTERFVLAAHEVRDTRFTFSPDNGRGKPPGQLYGRRMDLAGVGEAQPIAIANGYATLFPGRWELLLTPEAGYYVAFFAGGVYSPARKRRPDGWNEVLIESFALLRYTLSGGGATIAGVVKQAGDPVVGAPVFLEAWDPATRTRLTELRRTYSGLHGEWSFETIPPGTYRVCSTFEYGNPDSAAFDLIGAESLQADPRSGITRDLELYGSR
jgi:hypothetical protein